VVESHCPIKWDALQFQLSELGRRLVETTGDVRASSFLFNGFALRRNVLIRFCCTTLLFMTDGQSRVHYQILEFTFVIELGLPGVTELTFRLVCKGHLKYIVY